MSVREFTLPQRIRYVDQRIHRKCRTEVGFVRFRTNARFSGPLVRYLVNGPEGIVPIGIRIGHTCIEVWHDFNEVTTRLHAVPKATQFGIVHGTESFRYNLNGSAILHGTGKAALQDPILHIQPPDELVDGFGFGQVQGLPIHFHIDANPIRGIQHLGEVLGISVFPPPHFRLVRVVNACEV